MEDEERFDVNEALKRLKAGYALLSLADKKVTHFMWQHGKILVRTDNEGILLTTFVFLDLYKDAFFTLDDEANDEDAVDPKKDEEYYRWRQ
jgi:hypothetical protein